MLNDSILYFLREELLSDSLLLPLLLLLLLLLFVLCLITVSFGALSLLLRAEDDEDPVDSDLDEDLEDSTLGDEDCDLDSGADFTTVSDDLLFVTVVLAASDPLFALLLTVVVDLLTVLLFPSDEDLRTVPELWFPEGTDDLFSFMVPDDLRLFPEAWPCWVRLFELPLLTLPDDLRVELLTEPLFCLDEETPVDDLLLPDVDIVAALSGCAFA